MLSPVVGRCLQHGGIPSCNLGRKYCPLFKGGRCREVSVNGDLTSHRLDLKRRTTGVNGVVAQWCNPLTLQPKQSGGVGSFVAPKLIFGWYDSRFWPSFCLSCLSFGAFHG